MCPSLDAFLMLLSATVAGWLSICISPFAWPAAAIAAFSAVLFPFRPRGIPGYLRREIDLWQQRNPALKQARTLYFGGGTPSLLEADQIKSLAACSTWLRRPRSPGDKSHPDHCTLPAKTWRNTREPAFHRLAEHG